MAKGAPLSTAIIPTGPWQSSRQAPSLSAITHSTVSGTALGGMVIYCPCPSTRCKEGAPGAGRWLCSPHPAAGWGGRARKFDPGPGTIFFAGGTQGQARPDRTPGGWPSRTRQARDVVASVSRLGVRRTRLLPAAICWTVQDDRGLQAPGDTWPGTCTAPGGPHSQRGQGSGPQDGPPAATMLCASTPAVCGGGPVPGNAPLVLFQLLQL